jgi:hypothetical protein
VLLKPGQRSFSQMAGGRKSEGEERGLILGESTQLPVIRNTIKYLLQICRAGYIYVFYRLPGDYSLGRDHG